MHELGPDFDPRTRIVAPALPRLVVAEPVPMHLLGLLLGSGVASIALLGASLALLLC
jgi:hypothetical protein